MPRSDLFRRLARRRRRPTATRATGVSVVRRLVAFLVDAGLASVVVFLVATLLMLALGPALRLGPPRIDPQDTVLVDARLATVSAVAGILTGAAYFALSWRVAGATPGQRLLGLQVRASAAGGAITVPHALLRWAALGAPLWIAATVVPGGAGVLAVAGACAWSGWLLVSTVVSATGDGLHDRLSGTRVVDATRVDAVEVEAADPARAGTAGAWEVADVR